ncbi:hypothetical protein ABPG74_020305 [Tetrahymena malaccensis]
MPFQFNLYQYEKTCKTLVGGLITFLVYSISLAYFIYITNLYFTTGYQPKVSTVDLFQDNIPFQVSNDLFAFNFFIQNKGNIQQYENQTGKKYLSFLIYYQQFDSQGNLKSETLDAIKCQDTSFSEKFFQFFPKKHFSELGLYLVLRIENQRNYISLSIPRTKPSTVPYITERSSVARFNYLIKDQLQVLIIFSMINSVLNQEKSVMQCDLCIK